MKGRRIALVLAIAALPLVGALNPAWAAPPRAGCPPPFLGPLTFEQIVELFPPPPEIPPEEIEAQLSFFDTNGDRMLCIQDNPAPGVNVVDNAANVP